MENERKINREILSRSRLPELIGGALFEDRRLWAENHQVPTLKSIDRIVRH